MAGSACESGIPVIFAGINHMRRGLGFEAYVSVCIVFSVTMQN